jgi:Molecular chaperone, HSP90 family
MFSDLREILKVKDETLFYDSSRIRNEAIPLLSQIIDTFPEFTPHEIKHSDKIINILSWFIPERLKNALNSYEIYFLIISAYLHDIGMANLKEIKTFHGENPDSIREYHHIRSEKYIVENFTILGIEDKHQAEIIGRICRGHRKEDLNNKDLFKPERMYREFTINVPLLSEFMRICDELDLTFERTPAEIYENAHIQNEISKDEWERHLDTSGAGLSQEDPLKIICSAKCERPKIHRVLKKLETKINKELRNIPNHLYYYRDFIKEIPREFFMDITAVEYKAYDFKFSLQENEIFKLLMGERLYGNKIESIREVLKNAIDACKVKKDSLKENNSPYEPKIIIKLSDEMDKIIIDDNGVGMDETAIISYFMKIGNSYYRSSEFSEVNHDFTPVNELGIGILSYFMIANNIEVETKTDNSDSLILQINDLSDYFIVKKGNRSVSGTKVTLFLKDDFKEKEYLASITQYFTRHLEIPIMIEVPDGSYVTQNLGFLPTDYSTDNWHLLEINEDYCEGIIGLVLDKKNKPKWIRREEKPYFISNEGIFVGHINPLPKYFQVSWGSYYYLDLNLKKNALDLNIARNNIVPNPKLDIFQELLVKKVIIELEKLFNSFKKNKKENFEEHVNELINTYIKFEYYDDDLKRHVKTDFPDFLINFFKNNYYFKCISKKHFYFKTYSELTKSKENLKLFEIPYYYTEKHFQKIVANCSGFNVEDTYIVNDNLSELLFDIPKVASDSVIQIENTDGLEGLIPLSWEVVKFMNYNTSSLMEFADSNFAIINTDNPFIELIIQVKDKIEKDRKIAINGFFVRLRRDLKHKFDEIINNQRIILNMFVEDDLIVEEEIENYILKKEDFPTYFDNAIRV